ncbi:hypothetical protein [Cupriavidus sp. IDO]|uniref:hypothetical protein n=1 Tax=Cupriavidus sp. IDO TaxID=1539142 RepID=UPI001269AD3B|nr:hypothetical protein [Cupriavidus sp. IDO]
MIDKRYVHWAGGDASPRHRADVGWNWCNNLLYAQAHNATRFASRSSRTYAWAVLLKLSDKAGDVIPIGMTTTVPDFDATLAAHGRRGRAFVWYFADAPDDLYRELGIEPPRGVAKVLLDIAVQNRLDLSLSDACTFLHADPAGGPKLVKYYVKKVGMTQIRGHGPRISLWRRFKDREYLLWDDFAARNFCSTLDEFRKL